MPEEAGCGRERRRPRNVTLRAARAKGWHRCERHVPGRDRRSGRLRPSGGQGRRATGGQGIDRPAFWRNHLHLAKGEAAGVAGQKPDSSGHEAHPVAPPIGSILFLKSASFSLSPASGLGHPAVPKHCWPPCLRTGSDLRASGRSFPCHSSCRHQSS